MQNQESNLKAGDVIKVVDRYSEGVMSGYYRITSIRGMYANLGSIFGKTIYHKRVPLNWLIEAEAEWYSKWSHSESYMSM
jgi:hypothetical protein